MSRKTNAELQAELGRLQGIETYWNATLAVLRRIDDEMPASAKLPGSPTLEDTAWHLLIEYRQREFENTALKARVARLEAALAWSIEFLDGYFASGSEGFETNLQKAREVLGEKGAIS